MNNVIGQVLSKNAAQTVLDTTAQGTQEGCGYHISALTLEGYPYACCEFPTSAPWSSTKKQIVVADFWDIKMHNDVMWIC